MAKKKLTLEEKLEEAVVTDVPYEVPVNWVWSKIGSITNVRSSKRILAKEYIDEGIPFYRSKEIVELSCNIDVSSEIFISNERYQEICSKFGVPQSGDLLITSVGTIGNTWIVDDRKFYYKDGNITQIEKNNILKTEYIQKYVESPYFDMWVKGIVSGSAYNALTIEKLKNLYIPIPPLKEQQRIVDRIENLFEKLDTAKELIEEARGGFEKRKQSIIESALKGEFLSGVQLKEIELGSILNFKNGLSKRSGKEGIITKVLRLADIEDDMVYCGNSREMLLTEKEREKYKVENGDLVLIRVNGTKNNVGRAIQYFGDEICAYCDHLIRIDSEGYNKDYIKFLINSDQVRKQINELIVSSAGQNTISQSSLNVIKANVVEDLNTQVEIMNIINRFVDGEKRIEQLTQLEEQIELIKKSILAKAFRGELGTNCEEDGSALELLKEILSKS